MPIWKLLNSPWDPPCVSNTEKTATESMATEYQYAHVKRIPWLLGRTDLGQWQALEAPEAGIVLGRWELSHTYISSLLPSSSWACLCHPECQLSHKSTHWVSPSNLPNPAGKQHIRPLTGLMTAWLRIGILNKEREVEKKYALLFWLW